MNKIIKKERGYVQVSNNFLRDERISFKAKGLFCYMFSMNEDWNFTIKSIAKQQKDGYDAVQSALEELKKYDYVEYEKHSDGTGTYFLNDDPKTENPKLENPIMGKSTPIKKEQLYKNKKDNLLTIYESELGRELTQNEEKYLTDYIDYRKQIKKVIKTTRPLKAYISQIIALKEKNYNLDEAINIMKEKEWQTLEFVEKYLKAESIGREIGGYSV